VATDRARATYTTPKLSAQTGEPADLKSDDCTGLGLAAQLSMSFVPVGGKTLGIQIHHINESMTFEDVFSVPYLASCGWKSYP